MSFTCQNANKGNKFHIGLGKLLLVVVRECVVFNTLQPGLMYIPTYPTQELQLIYVKRVLDSCYKSSENYLQTYVPRNLAKIISCQIKNKTLVDTLIPIPANNHIMIFALFNYDVIINYIDTSGHIKDITLPSGPRHQRAFFTLPFESTKVDLFLECIGYTIL